MKNAYKFYYKAPYSRARTEYVYVIATLEESAIVYFKQSGLFDYDYDYAEKPIGMISGELFRKNHEIGDILGECAII